jgi:regulator of RNase E activity RraA
MRRIDDVPPGAVIILDNGGRADTTVCRDVALSRSLRYPVVGGDAEGVVVIPKNHEDRVLATRALGSSIG